MKLARTNLLRRTVMWAAGVVLVVSVAAWVVSLFSVKWLDAGFPALSVSLDNGVMQIHNHGPSGPSSRPGWHALGHDRPRLWWPSGVEWVEWVRAPDGTLFFDVFVPLWIPGAAAAILLAPTWFAAHRERRRCQLHSCTTCRYDLTGITGPCPECGGEKQECRA